MIPKIIHYCWFGGGRLPKLAKVCIRSWRKYCPDFRFLCWTEKNTDLSMLPYAREAYMEGKYAFVSDVVRLYVVYKFGGVYLDTDVQLIRPIGGLLRYDAFFGFEISSVATGLGFGAVKRARIVQLLFDDYDNLHFISEGRLDLTPCPARNRHVFSEYGFRLDGTLQMKNGVALFPSEYFCPKNYFSNRIKLTEHTVAVHHYSASWKTVRYTDAINYKSALIIEGCNNPKKANRILRRVRIMWKVRIFPWRVKRKMVKVLSRLLFFCTQST